MQITITINNTENIEPLSQEDKRQIEQIVQALVSTGGLTRVKGGQTIIHFDGDGVFQKVQHSYFPWIRRKSA